MSLAQPGDAVRLRFFLPPRDLAPFVTTIYQLDITGAQGEPIEDALHPEWANIRLITAGEIEAGIGGGPLAPVPRSILVGPTSHAVRFRAQSARSWGIGLLPLGWARLVDAPACEYADRFVDLAQERDLARLGALAACHERDGQSAKSFRDRLVDVLRTLLTAPQPRDAEIVRVEHALVDREVHNVAALSEKSGIGTRSLERLSKNVFGFPPQLLLRRQRFLRSLAQFMLDPSLRWIDALDSHYHDQAHFVRDFKQFMGTSPSKYARQLHPVLGAAVHARKAIAGEAVQVLHRPPAA